MHQLIWQKAVIKVTIHDPDISHLIKNPWVEEAMNNKENEVFWKALYSLYYVFSSLKELCNCNFDVTLMDKVFFLMKRLDDALLK